MNNNQSSTSTKNESSRVLEFMTVFGISLLFTFAGMHYLKSTIVETEKKMEVEIPIAVSEQPEAAKSACVALSKVVESMVSQ